MAFREDADALHARIESLEKELEDARRRVTELDGVEAERVRLEARVAALEEELGRKRTKVAAPKPRGGTAAASPLSRPPLNRADLRVLAVLVALIVVGLVVYWLATYDGAGSAGASAKTGDTRVPSLGVVDLSATPDPAPIAFTVTGTDSAPGDCRGYLPDAPQLVLRTSAPMLVRATTRCNVDLVAVLTGAPAGLLCDDDGGDGTNPSIETTVPAGDTRLSIGTYSEGATASCVIVLHAVALPAGADVHGLAASATPIASVSDVGGADARAGTVGTAYDGTVSGAIIQGSTLQPGCLGYFGSAPDLVVEVSEPSIVRVDATSDSDLVLLMQDPDGTFTCDDDAGYGNAPRIAKRVPAGRYPVWVGTFGEEPGPVSFHATVRRTTLASETARPVPSIDVAPGVPAHVTGWSDDELSAASMWSDCVVPGYVPYEPTATLRLASRGDLTISSSRGDLLLALTSHGERATSVRTCTADPEWRGTLDPGVYDLYVGVASGESARSEIDLTVSVAPPSVLPYTP